MKQKNKPYLTMIYLFKWPKEVLTAFVGQYKVIQQRNLNGNSFSKLDACALCSSVTFLKLQ